MASGRPHDQLRADGFDVRGEDVARLSPFVRQHINMLGCYSFHLPDLPGGLRPLRDPASPNGRVICRWGGAGPGSPQRVAAHWWALPW
ncbi:hypothetical protein [Streptomyces platensis]|uniref:hypothetical protein n=1 Tax=Streptomyces platensis TaxID=58346 RepID=UPI0027E3EE2C|nr:hypothetical protein [Streptomyces platensis]